MPSLTKFNTFPRDCLQGIHDFSSHTFKMLLTNVAPLAADTVKADQTEIAAGFGYAAGGPALAPTLSLTGSVAKVALADLTILAAGGAIGPFRYAVVYNDTATGDRLCGWADVGTVNLADGDSFVFDFDASAGAMTLT